MHAGSTRKKKPHVLFGGASMSTLDTNMLRRRAAFVATLKLHQLAGGVAEIPLGKSQSKRQAFVNTLTVR